MESIMQTEPRRGKLIEPALEFLLAALAAAIVACGAMGLEQLPLPLA